MPRPSHSGEPRAKFSRRENALPVRLRAAEIGNFQRNAPGLAGAPEIPSASLPSARSEDYGAPPP
jgi:hypothetical protein